MATDSKMNEVNNVNEESKITFTCRFCEEAKPYSEMVVMGDFFPPLTACRSCAQYINQSEGKEETQEEE